MSMGKDRTITRQVKPQRVCPICGEPIDKVIRYGQLSYQCKQHWGPWDEAGMLIARATLSAQQEEGK